ncbi:hypothetical protein LJR029_000127 [Caballeronia sp. LjRoot29]|uniref:VOC family protein n=1 Tax=Caballeronia sp. LjRoot29 TaxID=3342315 RepID=UPI003ECC2F4A
MKKSAFDERRNAVDVEIVAIGPLAEMLRSVRRARQPVRKTCNEACVLGRLHTLPSRSFNIGDVADSPGQFRSGNSSLSIPSCKDNSKGERPGKSSGAENDQTDLKDHNLSLIRHHAEEAARRYKSLIKNSHIVQTAKEDPQMKRTWTIIGVGDVAASFNWYQSLFGQPASSPAHNYFGQILDSDGTVLLCLHEWGANEHPSLAGPDHATPGNGLLLFSVWTISPWL